MPVRRGLLQRLLGVVPWLWSNWISLLGTTLATVAGNAILIVTVVDIVTGGANQYMATFGYLLMPLLFVLGLAVIALGVRRERRKRRVGQDGGALGQAYELVMADRNARRRVLFVVVATLANVTLISVAAFKGITWMDSPAFCGELCHSVMKPEMSAYRRSPHARVDCVECHIGAGASWFVRSKLSGLRQVYHTLTGDFPRPVPTPIRHLRPARETCEHCHWPAKFHGERMLVRHVYKSDERNTRLTNVVRLNVGGVNQRSGRYEGIHWHVSRDVQIEYESLDDKRSIVGKVTLVERGKTTVFMPTSAKAKAGKVVERRVMDCVDCHNRPTHIFEPQPEIAVDRALALGKLDASLPFLRQQAVALLRIKIADSQDAAAQLTRELLTYYQKNYPETARSKRRSIDKAGRELGWIYRKNIFPEMNITWNTYPSHLGHRQTTEGCFRCHDDAHEAAGGKTIPQDCDLCHELLAEEEEQPDVPAAVLRLGRM